jgi:hypothetical protein
MADQNEQHLLKQTGNLLRQARPEISAVRLDEIKRDVLARRGSKRMTRGTAAVIRRRVLAMTLAVMLFAISTSNAAAQALNFISGGTLGKTLGVTGKTAGTQFFFGTLHFGGDGSDDAGHHTYCKDDGKGSDKSSSDGDGKGSYGSKSSSSKSGTTSIRTTTSTYTGGGSQGTDHSSSDGKDPCKPRDDHSSSDGKGSDGTDHHDGKDDKYGGGKDDKYGGGKDDKSSGGKDDKSSGKDDKYGGGKSGGKSGGKG